MKPSCSILDAGFHYVPSIATSVSDTWKRFGWIPEAERRPARRPQFSPGPSAKREAAPAQDTRRRLRVL